MIGAIAGDIAGSRFEGRSAPSSGFELFTLGCQFTDDTVCTIAIADAVLRGGDFAETLKAYVRRHPNRGYGGMFSQWALSDAMAGYRSWGNGAPMRVAAIGWLAEDEAEADRLAEAQACVSHDHPHAIAAAQAVARAILALRSGADVDALRDDLSARFGYDLQPEHALASGGFDISAAGTVPPALSAALTTDSWEAAIRTVIGLGGDTDTLACIAGAVAEARHGVPDDIAALAQSYLTPDLLDVLDRFKARLSRV